MSAGPGGSRPSGSRPSSPRFAKLDEALVISCEHPSNRLPPGYELDEELIELHIAWDPGAEPVARRLARRFDAPLHLGRWSRLLVDLNRSPDNPDLVRSTSDGHPIPFNREVDEEELELRMKRWYWPYRNAVVEDIEARIAGAGGCVHVSVHSFTPVLSGRRRRMDLGVLFDPSRRPEAPAARALREALDRETGLAVWLNHPYRGTSDGLLPWCRERFPADRYIGIEIEINQRLADDEAELARVGDALAGGLEACVEAETRHPGGHAHLHAHGEMPDRGDDR